MNHWQFEWRCAFKFNSHNLSLLPKQNGPASGLNLHRTCTAQGSTRRAAALTQRPLAFSRRQTLDPKPIDVNKVISGMEDLIRRTVGPAIQLEVVGAGGLWLTKGDPPQNELPYLSTNARDG